MADKEPNFKGNKQMTITELQEFAKERTPKTLWFIFRNAQGIEYDGMFLDAVKGLFVIQDENARVMTVEDWCTVIGEETFKFIPKVLKSEQEMYLLNRSN